MAYVYRACRGVCGGSAGSHHLGNSPYGYAAWFGCLSSSPIRAWRPARRRLPRAESLNQGLMKITGSFAAFFKSNIVGPYGFETMVQLKSFSEAS